MLAIIVSIGGFIFGFDASVISGVVGFVTAEFSLNAWQQGFVVSAPTLGAVLASIGAGPLSDRIGRRKVLIIIAALYVVSAIISAFAPSYAFLVVARFIGGLAFASLLLAPMYIAEIAPSHLRGRLISINQLNIMIGFSAAYFSNYLFLQLSQTAGVGWLGFSFNENTWRWMLGIEAIPAIAYFALLFLIPESPRWLIINGQADKAESIFARLLNKAQAQVQINEIKNTLSEKPLSIFQALKQLFGSKMRLALLVGLSIAVVQQVTGINAVYFYAPSIFELSGVGKNAAFIQAIWIGLINLFFTIFAIFMIDKLGRKPLLLIGLFGVVVSMATIAYGFSQATYRIDQQSVHDFSTTIDKQALTPVLDIEFHSDVEFKQALNSALGENVVSEHQGELMKAATTMNSTLILVGLLAFVSSFAISLGPVMWVLLAEIFPNQVRAVAISVCGIINSGASFLTQLVFPSELATFGAAWTFSLYGLFAAVGIILMYWLLPETKGKSLEEMEAVFAKKQQGNLAPNLDIKSA